MTGRTQAGRLHHSRPRDCRAVRVFHPASSPSGRRPAIVQASGTGDVPEKPLEMHGDQPGSDASISTNRPPFHRCSREGEADPPARSGRPVFRSPPIAADHREPGDLPSVPGEKPTLGKRPAASTEVVLAERLNSARPGAADGGLSASCVEYVAPPSVLPDISPRRGEIGSAHRLPQTIDVGRRSCHLPISPPVGEMSGRTEGGITSSSANYSIRGANRSTALRSGSVAA